MISSSTCSIFSSETTSPSNEVYKSSNRVRFVSKPIKDPRKVISKNCISSERETSLNNFDFTSATVFLLKLVNRIRNNPETYNEDSLITKAKKYCWVENIWGPKVQLIGLIFSFSRFDLRFFFRYLNEYLLPGVVYSCHSRNCLEAKPFVFRNINKTSVLKGQFGDFKPDFGGTRRVSLCRNCIDDWICTENCKECITDYEDRCDWGRDCKKNVKSLVCSLKSNKLSSIVYLQLVLDKDEYPEIYEKDIGRFRFANGFIDKEYFPEWKKHLVYWDTHNPDDSGPET